MKLLSLAPRPFTSLLAVALLGTGALSSQAGTAFPAATFAAVAKTPALSGTVGDVKYKANTSGTGVHVKASVSVTNSGTKGAKNVTATVYLSNDNKLDSTDTKVITVNLADYNNGVGTLPKGKTLSLTFKRLFPNAIAKGLQGKYLLVVLGADNLDPSTVTTPIVVGPLNTP